MTNNLEEYADPIGYDYENDSFEPDGPFYSTLAQRIGGSVLEIGCGTGRITIPMAVQGINITGLDIVPEMLQRAKAKASNLAINWVEADARTFNLGRQFNVIFESGATFQHMLERADQEEMLSSAREHLVPDGRFIISSIFPKPELLVDEETEQEWFTYHTNDGRDIHVSGTQHYDAVRQIKTETAFRRWQDTQAGEVVKAAPLMLRYVYPQEMEALLHYNGLVVLERYGDMDFSPLTNESAHMIYVCAKR